ncbi:unnamed protein product [Trichobilharzia regenti]|nr:unnamed protein product [Trichobilharzia regenti]
MEKAFDIGGSGYPFLHASCNIVLPYVPGYIVNSRQVFSSRFSEAMVAVHGRKMKRTTLRGSFSSNSVHEFLRALSVGGANLPLFDVKSLPEIKTVEPWDGKDAKVNPTV